MIHRLALILLFVSTIVGNARDLDSEWSGEYRGVVYITDGDGGTRSIGGRVSSLTDSGLTVDDGDRFHTLSRGSIDHVDLIIRPQGDAAFAGLAAGAYLANYIVARNRHDASNFDRYERSSTSFNNFPGAGILALGVMGGFPGGLVGFAIGSTVTEKRVRFDIAGDREAWRRLRELVEAPTQRWKTSVTIAALPGATGRDGGIAARYLREGEEHRSVDIHRDEEFEWMRRIRLSYRLDHSVDLGFTIANGSLPSTEREFYITEMEGKEEVERMTRRVSTRLDATGYLPTVGYHPLGAGSGRFDVELGAGIGIAKIDYSEKLETVEIGGLDTLTTLSGIQPIASLTADISYRLTPGLSLGIGADLLVQPALKSAIMPENAGVREGDVPTASAGVGVTLGYAF